LFEEGGEVVEVDGGVVAAGDHRAGLVAVAEVGR
jgi:hypothetical protein